MEELDKEKFVAALLKAKQAAAETRAKSIAAAEAEKAKQRAYELECKLRQRVIDMYTASRPNNDPIYAWFRMPDGTMVKLDGNMIWFDGFTQL